MKKAANLKQNTISCRVRNHNNFLAVVNRATVRLGLKNHTKQGSGHLVGEAIIRCTCLDSGTPDFVNSDQLNRHRQSPADVIYKR